MNISSMHSQMMPQVAVLVLQHTMCLRMTLCTRQSKQYVHVKMHNHALSA